MKTLGEITVLSAENRELKEELESLKRRLKSNIPEISIEVNNESQLDIPFDSKLEIGKLGLQSMINEKDIPKHLEPYLEKEKIEKYNSLVVESNRKIEKYNSELETYKRAIETGIEYQITLFNEGKAKATNIFVDMYFPEEVDVIEGGIGGLTAPEIPEIPKDPLQEAEAKYYKKLFKSPLADLSPFYAQNASFGGLQLSNRIYGSISPSDLIFDKNNFISFSPNELTIKCSTLMHTREKTFDKKFILVPKRSGEYKMEVNIICEEYTEPITKEFIINVYEESLKAKEVVASNEAE